MYGLVEGRMDGCDEMKSKQHCGVRLVYLDCSWWNIVYGSVINSY